MKKRILSFVAALLLLLSMTVPAFATESWYGRYGEAGDTENLQAIFQLSETIYETYNIDAFYLFNDDLSGEGSASNYAREQAPEISSVENGICYASTSDYDYVYTWGSCDEIFSEDYINTLYEQCGQYEVSDNIEMAALTFFSNVYSVLSASAGSTADMTPTAEETTADAAEEATDTLEEPAVLSSGFAYGPNNTILVGENYGYTKVFDLGDDLTDEQEQALEAKLVEISDRQQFNVIALTVSSLDGKSSMAYADDFYDYNNLGYGTNHDGCLLLICPETRDYWISTTGYAITALTDAGIEYIGDSIIPAMKKADWNSAFETYAETVDKFVTQAKTDKPYDVGNLPKAKKTASEIIKGILISLVVGLAVAFIVMKSVKSGYTKAVHQKSNATDYLVNGSLQITGAYENFLYNNVTQTRIERESSSGGGSSTHSGSSGTSHGGGGGKF